GQAYNGFIAQMFLVPQFIAGDNTTNNMQYGPTDSSIDWNSGSVIYMTVGRNANGTATADWRYKTNEFGGQTMAFNDQDGGQYGTNGWIAGHIANLTCSTGPLGVWSCSFNNNTNVTMRAPDGSVTNFILPAAAANIFQDPMYAYFGTQPNNNARIGQQATFKEIKIEGASTPLDNTFTPVTPPYVRTTTTR